MKFHANVKKTFLVFFLLTFSYSIFSCVSTQIKNYDEVLTTWTSYEDVAKWMERNYSYDIPKAKKSMAEYVPGQKLPVLVKSPRQSYEERTGMCFDAANFAKDALNSIDPYYDAQIVYIESRPYFKPNHIVCSFKKNGQLYIMDYGVPKKTLRRGVFGPFASLEDYAEFYIKKHPKVTRIKSISYGWPDYFKDSLPN
jgi:hypothetical protein